MSSEEDLRMKEAAERAKYLRSTLKSFTGRPDIGPLAVIKTLIESSTVRTLERMGQAPWAQQSQPPAQFQDSQPIQQGQAQPQQALPNNGRPRLFQNLQGLFQPPPQAPPLTEEQIAIREEEFRKQEIELERVRKAFEKTEKLKRLRRSSVIDGSHD